MELIARQVKGAEGRIAGGAGFRIERRSQPEFLLIAEEGDRFRDAVAIEIDELHGQPIVAGDRVGCRPCGRRRFGVDKLQ